ncbi:hypothetical protein CTA2_2818 [Colletotrichum tanaceti]|uniref:Uncharacterized protein n=1 Tax=Colletotrichum tanaceti TaxID=1306861 RepID=A0A4U6X1S6_9PEZI|nr:hypothetical protein CTA2_2818 [Colletotrichum tanaceti]TKW49095.1 hypothetical protein CTA1_8170 [Colletotrichum tanaceti]
MTRQVNPITPYYVLLWERMIPYSPGDAREAYRPPPREKPSADQLASKILSRLSMSCHSPTRPLTPQTTASFRPLRHVILLLTVHLPSAAKKRNKLSRQGQPYASLKTVKVGCQVDIPRLHDASTKSTLMKLQKAARHKLSLNISRHITTRFSSLEPSVHSSNIL